MKVKTSELTGAALDWAVAKATGLLDAGRVVVDFKYMSGEDPVRWEPRLSTYYSSAYSPADDWAQGGPIIEREGINIERVNNHGKWEAWTPAPERRSGEAVEQGPTPLIAAMRCYVASKLGDEVEVPDELIKGESK